MKLPRRLLALAVVLGVLAALSAQATPRILRAFGTRYPEAREKLGNCTTCHTDTVPQMNPYGADLKKAGADFAKVDSLDSDGDGVLNRVEIAALTRPGDPKSKPEPIGEVEARHHPGGRKEVATVRAARVRAGRVDASGTQVLRMRPIL